MNKILFVALYPSPTQLNPCLCIRKGQTCMGSTKATAVIATVSCHACNHRKPLGKGGEDIPPYAKNVIWYDFLPTIGNVI